MVSPSGRDSSLGRSKVVGEEGARLRLPFEDDKGVVRGFTMGVSSRRVAASVVPVPPQLMPCKEEDEAASSPCIKKNK